MNPLAELFPEEDHQFHLTLRRGELREFFAPIDPSGQVLAERRRWLDEPGTRYADQSPRAAPLVEELASVVGLGTETDVRALGRRLEPDVLLLAADPSDGRYRLEAGALCFPTSWALGEKMGRTLDAIHGVVPGLNAALGHPLDQFLGRMRPGPAYLRANWGFAATRELNLHPALRRPRLDGPFDPASTWLRVEHQALARLPSSDGIVFGIRIALHPWADVVADPVVRRGLHRALRTLPTELAAYKGLAQVLPAMVAATVP